jgi:hypothetical protein
MPRYSLKPGRGPSFMGGFAAVCAVLFGIVWTAAAASMGAPGFFPLFGVIFCLMGVGMAVYNLSNATRKNRYSILDVTTENEEPDPLNERFGRRTTPRPGDAPGERANRFCPYCGEPLQEDFEFCPNCGEEQPERPD